MIASKHNLNYLLPAKTEGNCKVVCSILEQTTNDCLFNKKSNAIMVVTTEVTTEVKKLILNCKREQTRSQLQQLLGLKESEHFRKAYIKPAIKQGLLEMTIPDKPNSRNQKYRLTGKGIVLRGEL
ncbi:MAG: hypothetical protein L3J83_08985 [Proteobacteria bacterium]|nr:hypothetical protein [Pseudomonadota bacterium]